MTFVLMTYFMQVFDIMLYEASLIFVLDYEGGFKILSILLKF